ncbi:zinc finger HIT domain-containing protein 2 [Bacillus rossius redtenbacheri]|uniref:zinc finger HIT domain-containing protein 2 n=1 Tax=Bacillus rossius redtenbacheri TaxID=93214 RepID=UPI002FDE803A
MLSAPNFRAIKAVKKLTEISDASYVSPGNNQNSSDKPDRRLCSICRSVPQKYVCPRCNAPYCSLPCYKSPAHSNCSEAFYRECVMEEMKSSPVNPKPAEEMLQRAYEMSQQEPDIGDIFADDDPSSSDDEESASSHAKQ